MKKWLCVLCGCLAVSGLRAQTSDEWLKQTSTRLKYYGEQIAELLVFIKDLEQGYSIVEHGINTIGAIKKGEFDLHNAFYSSLESVNPVISKLGAVAEIVALQAAIIERFSSSLARYKQSPSLGSGEVEYIGQVYQTALTDAQADVTMLIEILTANKFKMTDDQRMGRLRDLDQQMRDRYAFTAGFTDQADMLCIQRAQEASDIGTVQGLYGIP